jgi:hypothetical protein
MKHSFPLLAVLALSAATSEAAIVVENYSYTVGSPVGNIPDTGLTAIFSQATSGSQIETLTSVRVGLHLTGTTSGEGWAGDLYVALNRDLGSQSAVLLNQVGATAGNPAGHAYDGWNMTLRDDAAADIHGVELVGGVLTGTYQADGRLSPTDSARNAQLAVFNGLTGNGTWYLNLADLNPSGAMVLHGWSLELVGNGYSPVPEPRSWAAFSGLLLAGFAAWRRRRTAQPGAEEDDR